MRFFKTILKWSIVGAVLMTLTCDIGFKGWMLLGSMIALYMVLKYKGEELMNNQTVKYLAITVLALGFISEFGISSLLLVVGVVCFYKMLKSKKN